MPISEKKKAIILKNDKNIIHIDLNNRGLIDQDIEELKDLLLQNLHITSINLSRNNLSSRAAKILSECINLKNINLSENNINDIGVTELLKISDLENLNLSRNNITDKGAQEILEKCNQNLEIKIYDNRKVSDELIEGIEKKCSMPVENNKKSKKAEQVTSSYGSHWNSPKDSPKTKRINSLNEAKERIFKMIHPILNAFSNEEKKDILQDLEQRCRSTSPTQKN